MFNPFARKKVDTSDAAIEIGFLAFAEGLRSGIEMVRIAARRNESLNQKFSLNDVADLMQQSLDDFKAERKDESSK